MIPPARAFLGTLSALAAIWSCSPWAAAALANGVLDPTFGSNGVVRTSQADNPERFAVGADGSIAMQFHAGLVEYLPNGELNSRFGERGLLPFERTGEGLLTIPGISGRRLELSNIAVDGSGRVVLFGTALSPAGKRIFSGVSSVPESKAAVVRLGTDGTLDPSFGFGRGFVLARFGLRSPEPSIPLFRRSVQALDGAVDSQGRPVLLAGVAGTYAPCDGHSQTAPTPRAVVRLTAAGSRDLSFSGDGVSPLLREMGPVGTTALALDGADGPLATGLLGGGCPPKRLVVRLGADGRPVARFGEEGRRVYRKEFDLLAPSGEMFMRSASGAGRSRPDRRLFAFNPKGGPNEKFGDRGALVPPGLPRGSFTSLSGVDAEGRLLLVGGYRVPNTAAPGKPGTGIVAIERRLPDGEVDPTFGYGGRLLSPIPGLTLMGEPEAMLDSQGRLLVIVSARREGQTESELVLMRFLLWD